MTKHLAIASLALVAALAPAAGARPQSGRVAEPRRNADGSTTIPAEWARFAPEGAGFSVLVPGTPLGEERTIDFNGQVRGTFGSYTLRKDGLLYVIGYRPLALVVRDDTLAEELLARARGEAERELHAKVVDDRPVTVSGRPGRRTKLAMDDRFLEMLAVLGDTKMITLTVATDGTTETGELAAAAAKFFDSLETR